MNTLINCFKISNVLTSDVSLGPDWGRGCVSIGGLQDHRGKGNSYCRDDIGKTFHSRGLWCAPRRNPDPCRLYYKISAHTCIPITLRENNFVFMTNHNLILCNF